MESTIYGIRNEIVLEDDGSATSVTTAMSGPRPLLSVLSGLKGLNESCLFDDLYDLIVQRSLHYYPQYAKMEVEEAVTRLPASLSYSLEHLLLKEHTADLLRLCLRLLLQLCMLTRGHVNDLIIEWLLQRHATEAIIRLLITSGSYDICASILSACVNYTAQSSKFGTYMDNAVIYYMPICDILLELESPMRMDHNNFKELLNLTMDAIDFDKHLPNNNVQTVKETRSESCSNSTQGTRNKYDNILIEDIGHVTKVFSVLNKYVCRLEFSFVANYKIQRFLAIALNIMKVAISVIERQTSSNICHRVRNQSIDSVCSTTSNTKSDCTSTTAEGDGNVQDAKMAQCSLLIDKLATFLKHIIILRDDHASIALSNDSFMVSITRILELDSTLVSSRATTSIILLVHAMSQKMRERNIIMKNTRLFSLLRDRVAASSDMKMAKAFVDLIDILCVQKYRSNLDLIAYSKDDLHENSLEHRSNKHYKEFLDETCSIIVDRVLTLLRLGLDDWQQSNVSSDTDDNSTDSKVLEDAAIAGNIIWRLCTTLDIAQHSSSSLQAAVLGMLAYFTELVVHSSATKASLLNTLPFAVLLDSLRYLSGWKDECFKSRFLDFQFKQDRSERNYLIAWKLLDASHSEDLQSSSPIDSPDSYKTARARADSSLIDEGDLNIFTAVDTIDRISPSRNESILVKLSDELNSVLTTITKTAPISITRSPPSPDWLITGSPGAAARNVLLISAIAKAGGVHYLHKFLNLSLLLDSLCKFLVHPERAESDTLAFLVGSCFDVLQCILDSADFASLSSRNAELICDLSIQVIKGQHASYDAVTRPHCQMTVFKMMSVVILLARRHRHIARRVLASYSGLYNSLTALDEQLSLIPLMLLTAEMIPILNKADTIGEEIFCALVLRALKCGFFHIRHRVMSLICRVADEQIGLIHKTLMRPEVEDVLFKSLQDCRSKHNTKYLICVLSASLALVKDACPKPLWLRAPWSYHFSMYVRGLASRPLLGPGVSQLLSGLLREVREAQYVWAVFSLVLKYATALMYDCYDGNITNLPSADSADCAQEPAKVLREDLITNFLPLLPVALSAICRVEKDWIKRNVEIAATMKGSPRDAKPLPPFSPSPPSLLSSSAAPKVVTRERERTVAGFNFISLIKFAGSVYESFAESTIDSVFAFFSMDDVFPMSTYLAHSRLFRHRPIIMCLGIVCKQFPENEIIQKRAMEIFRCFAENKIDLRLTGLVAPSSMMLAMRKCADSFESAKSFSIVVTAISSLVPDDDVVNENLFVFSLHIGLATIMQCGQSESGYFAIKALNDLASRSDAICELIGTSSEVIISLTGLMEKKRSDNRILVEGLRALTLWTKSEPCCEALKNTERLDAVIKIARRQLNEAIKQSVWDVQHPTREIAVNVLKESKILTNLINEKCTIV